MHQLSARCLPFFHPRPCSCNLQFTVPHLHLEEEQYAQTQVREICYCCELSPWIDVTQMSLVISKTLFQSNFRAGDLEVNPG